MAQLIVAKLFFATLPVKRLVGRDSAGQAKFVESLFGIAA
jgi:hypothetical protein